MCVLIENLIFFSTIVLRHCDTSHFLLVQSRVSFSARNSLTKRKWEPSEKRSGDPSTTARLRRSRPAPVIYPDEIAALYSCTIDCAREDSAKKRTDRATDLLWSVRSTRRGRGEKWKTVRERKEGPVIGICAVEKPWKINYRPCKGAENYIDRRRERARRG